MSKITFRADDDLVRRIEALDASKSEIMRDALREYLDGREEPESGPARAGVEGSLDALVAERVDALLAKRLAADATPSDRDVNVNISVEGGASHTASDTQTPPVADPSPERVTDETTCVQCGENVDENHVYCPNCGEKASRRLFCDCGDEIRTDWAFCPSCGRRTPSADVLDRT